MNVLIADDDGVSRILLGAALSNLGHDVVEAESGAQALAIWQRTRQGLVISDWMMPDIDGLELCRKIRANTSSDLTYIILLTARRGNANYIEAMEAGVDDFISKPFEKQQLAARVRVADRILGLHENLRITNNDLERRVLVRTAELEKALAGKSEFFSRASHELRTPMNHVLGFAQLLLLADLPAAQKENVQHILGSGHHLLELIDRILAVSKSQLNDVNSLTERRVAEDGGRLRKKEAILSDSWVSS